MEPEPQYDARGDLRSPSYDEKWDQELKDAFTHYNLTGEIQEILYPGFDQHGKWAGIETSEGNLPDQDLTYKISSGTLPEAKLIHTNDAGEKTLNGSFHSRSRETVTVEFHHIKGNIIANDTNLLRLPNLKTIEGNLAARVTRILNAPHLERAGGEIGITGAHHLHAPELKSVTGELDAYQAKTINLEKLETLGSLDVSTIHELELPALKTVTGNIFAGEANIIKLPQITTIKGYLNGTTATEIHAPKLTAVANLDTSFAAQFYSDKIQVKGTWEMHPDAKKNWMAKQAKTLIKQMPEIEI